MTRTSTRVAVVAAISVWAVVCGYCAYLWAAGPFAYNHYLQFQSVSDFFVTKLGFVFVLGVPLVLVLPYWLERCRTTRMLAWLAPPSFVFLAWSVVAFSD